MLPCVLEETWVLAPFAHNIHVFPAEVAQEVISGGVGSIAVLVSWEMALGTLEERVV